ncbi:MAG TPA: co-chaperone GroES [Pirellulales bacterium]|jgi:chaperonin GroES|nr:co-chaperone GroES [Pirellulales bacterium]HEX4146818.1 co-chaperone GroES [Pirellulales bacterium]
MKVVPVGEHVVVKQFEEVRTSQEALILPHDADQVPHEGRVLSVGDGRLLPCGERVHPRVIEGDRVLFDGAAAVEVDIDGSRVLILNEDEILAVLD